MINLKNTINNIFMRPTLDIPMDMLEKHGFINAYESDKGRDTAYSNCVFLLFHPPSMDKFRLFVEKEQERSSSLVDDYDYEGGYVVLVYKLDRIFKKDFDLVRKGMYSKTSKSFQDRFPKVKKQMVNGLHRDTLSLQFMIFNKTPNLADFWEKELGVRLDEKQELWKGYDPQSEILDMEKIRQKV